MSERLGKVNESIQRCLNEVLREYFQAEAVLFSITRAKVASDLKDARVYFSFLEEKNAAAAQHFFKKNAKRIAYFFSSKIQLKYTPRLQFYPDFEALKQSHLLDAMDALEHEGDVAPENE